MTAKSKYQEQFDALPEWVQKLVRSLDGRAGHGYGTPAIPLTSKNVTSCYVYLKGDAVNLWSDAMQEAMNLSDALSAPWPPPEAPPREKRVFNMVEMIDDEGGFDQLLWAREHETLILTLMAGEASIVPKD